MNSLHKNCRDTSVLQVLGKRRLGDAAGRTCEDFYDRPHLCCTEKIIPLGVVREKVATRSRAGDVRRGQRIY